MYGKRLQEIRKELKLSQDEISAQLGISYRAYTSYERGDRKPPLNFLYSLFFEFNVNLNWLITGVGEKFNKTEEYTNDPNVTIIVEQILKKHKLI